MLLGVRGVVIGSHHLHLSILQMFNLGCEECVEIHIDQRYGQWSFSHLISQFYRVELGPRTQILKLIMLLKCLCVCVC